MTAIEREMAELGEWAVRFEAAAAECTLHPCQIKGCNNYVAGSLYCYRCQEEINAEYYPLANVLLEASPIRFLAAFWRRIWRAISTTRSY